MFGVRPQLLLGGTAARRTWNCVARYANLLWLKVFHSGRTIMPRSRRRHHSHSRSRSRSHSHDRDRDVKRRKIDNYESPQHHRKSVSDEEGQQQQQPGEDANVVQIPQKAGTGGDCEQNAENDAGGGEKTSLEETDTDKNAELVDMEDETSATPEERKEEAASSDDLRKNSKEKLEVTPRKAQSPRQLQKRLESEKKRLEKQREREEREKKRLEEKERARVEKEKKRQEKEELRMKEKQDKLEQKQKELEMRQKEKEMKEEQKRKEKDEKEQKRKEKEEQRRKEKEMERQKRQQEQDERNKEKQKLEEQKQKAAVAFANFFVTRKSDAAAALEEKPLEKKASIFKDFEIKSDMRLAPLNRRHLADEEKADLEEIINSDVGLQKPQEETYLEELKYGKRVPGKSVKTWSCDDDEDVIIVDDGDLGQTIDEQKPKLEKMRVKFLWFHDNQRPPYYGTWRKRSRAIKPRNPLAQDKELLDYEVDSDDDWEDEEPGESLSGSEGDADGDGDDKENEYEEDNVFFVPHGHLSEDEVDDEENAKLDPEVQKAKLKLLKNEFDEEMKSKTKKFQPRSIGCIFYDGKDLEGGGGVDEAIDKFLKPFSMIVNGVVVIKKRSQLFSEENRAKGPAHRNKKLVF